MLYNQNDPNLHSAIGSRRYNPHVQVRPYRPEDLPPGSLYIPPPIKLPVTEEIIIASGRVPEFRAKPDCDTKVPTPKLFRDLVDNVPKQVRPRIPSSFNIPLPCIETKQSQITIYGTINIPKE